MNTYIYFIYFIFSNVAQMCLINKHNLYIVIGQLMLKKSSVMRTVWRVLCLAELSRLKAHVQLRSKFIVSNIKVIIHCSKKVYNSFKKIWDGDECCKFNNYYILFQYI